MFSLYIYWSNCDPESESLHHRKYSAISGKITKYKSLNKALLALRYSLLVRNVAAEIIGNTLFSTSVYANTIHYTHRFFITRIYAYMYINNTYLQYWQYDSYKSCTFWSVKNMISRYIKHRLRTQISQELLHICSKRVTNEILFSQLWGIESGKNRIWEE